jgi:hypothetical protein
MDLPDPERKLFPEDITDPNLSRRINVLNSLGFVHPEDEEETAMEGFIDYNLELETGILKRLFAEGAVSSEDVGELVGILESIVEDEENPRAPVMSKVAQELEGRRAKVINTDLKIERLSRLARAISHTSVVMALGPAKDIHSRQQLELYKGTLKADKNLNPDVRLVLENILAEVESLLPPVEKTD